MRTAADDEAPRELSERFSTHIEGLDTILGGGFFRGTVNLILGPPGSGKTILAGQVAFGHVAAGGSAVFMTMLGEPHARTLAQFGKMHWFRPELVPDQLYLVSGYREVEEGGPDALLSMIRRLLHERRASLFVFDGLSLVETLLVERKRFEKFMHELQAVVGALGCTALLLAGTRSGASPSPEHTLVDSVTFLEDVIERRRAARQLHVTKVRGSGYIRGCHFFRIDERGVTVFPRLEALVAEQRPTPPEGSEHLSTGIARLDEMLRGGFITGSSTALIGAPGSGKTLLGLSFLAAGARVGEPGLYFGFYESPARLAAKGDRVSLGITPLVEAGRLHLHWQPPLECILDDLGQRILELQKRTGARRMFIDGIDGFQTAAFYPDRMMPFFDALTLALRSRGVTTVYTQETALFEADVHVPIAGVSAAVENLILLRYVELHAQLRRLISIMKVREQAYDSALREFTIADGGIDVAPTFESAIAVLSGIARTTDGDGPGAPPGKPR